MNKPLFAPRAGTTDVNTIDAKCGAALFTRTPTLNEGALHAHTDVLTHPRPNPNPFVPRSRSGPAGRGFKRAQRAPFDGGAPLAANMER